MMIAPHGRGRDWFLPLTILLSIGVAVHGQTTYTINTIAGTDAGIGDGGPATSAQLSASAIAVDNQNNIYVLDGNRIRRIDRGGVITTFFARSPHDVFGDLSMLTIDSSGNFYVGDTQNPTIKFAPDGTVGSIPNVSNTSYSIVPDGIGGFYAIGNTQFVGHIGADGSNKIYAGQFPVSGFIGDGGPATSATLCGPVGLAVDSQGNLFISEGFGNRIRKVSFSSGIIATVAGSTNVASNSCSGASGASGDGGPAASALLSSPAAMTIDGQDNLYFYDVGNARIRKISPSQVITTYAVLSPQIAAGNASQTYIDGLAFDRYGNLLLAAGNVWSISPAGTVSAIAGTGKCCTGLDAGPATSVAFSYPGPLGVAADGLGSVFVGDSIGLRRIQNGTISTIKPGYIQGIASDHNGTVYFSELQTHTIQKMTANGATSTHAGSGQSQSICPPSPDGDNGPATAANLCFPRKFSVDPKGNLYFIDDYGGATAVRRVSLSGVITTVASGSPSNPVVEGGSALSARFVGLSAVASDGNGNIYLTASGDGQHVNTGVLMKVAPDGTIHTLAGNTNFVFVTEGILGTDAFIEYTSSLAVSNGGDVYFGYGARFSGAFNYDHIVQFLPDGTLHFIAGGGTGLGLGDGGPATLAKLWGPSAMDIDGAGNIYFVDSGNERIRVLTPSRGSCQYVVTRLGFASAIVEVGQSGGTLTFNIQTADGCPWVVAGLPTWLTLNGNTTAAGPVTVEVTAAPGSGAPRTATISVAGIPIQIRQDGGSAVPLTITTASPLQPASTYVTYSLSLGATGGSAPYTWSVASGALPSGLTLSPSGAITGRPATAGTSTFTIKVTDNAGTTVTKLGSLLVYTCTNTTTPVITSVNSAGGYGGYSYFTSGSWLEIKGTNLADPADPRVTAPVPGQWTSSDFNGVNAPTSLDGISVSINGKPAYVSYISPTQLNVQAPADSATGNVAVTVTSCQATSQPVMVRRQALAPGLLAPSSFNVGGAQYMVATFASDGAYVLNSDVGVKLGVNSRPAKAGDLIVAYGIGFGDVTPSVLPGVIVQQSNTLVNPVTIFFGPNNTAISYAGLAGGFIGLYEFYFTVPSNLANADYKINVTQNGNPLPQTMFLSVHN